MAEERLVRTLVNMKRTALLQMQTSFNFVWNNTTKEEVENEIQDLEKRFD